MSGPKHCSLNELEMIVGNMFTALGRQACESRNCHRNAVKLLDLIVIVFWFLIVFRRPVGNVPFVCVSAGTVHCNC